MRCQVCGARLEFSMWDPDLCEMAAYCCGHWYHAAEDCNCCPVDSTAYVFSGPETSELQQRLERERAFNRRTR